MTQDEMKKKLEALHEECTQVIQLKEVFIDTALYAYLRSAEYCLMMATMQSKDIINLDGEEVQHG